MPLPAPNDPDPFRRLVAIMEALLSEQGCPWDREQTHESLKRYAIEEVYEVVEAIDDGDMGELCAELGDLGLQIVFHAALARRAGAFTVDDVYTAICDKLVRRHPHVFGERDAADAEAVLRNWEAIKREERAEKAGEEGPAPSALDGIPRALPSLQRAYKLQAKAAKVGFDWGEVESVLEKIREETAELEAELAPRSGQIGAPVKGTGGTPEGIDRAAVEDELGDLLFAMVNLARFLKIDPEQALQATNRKFDRRFRFVEERLAADGRRPEEATLEEMDGYWNEAKARERAARAPADSVNRDPAAG